MKTLSISLILGTLLQVLVLAEGVSVDCFVAMDCPIANVYAPEIERLSQTYQEKGVSFRLIFPDGDLDETKIKKHLETYKLSIPFLIDRDHSLVARAGVSTTPEVVVYDQEGKIAYRGKIDNRYEDYGVRRAKATEFYLKAALDAILSGKAPAIAKTEAIGCLIEPLSPSR